MVKKDVNVTNVQVNIKKESCFTQFFDEPRHFNRSPDGEVMEELSKMDIDFMNGTARKRK